MTSIHAPGFAVDSVALGVGAGERTRVIRASAQWDWKRNWAISDGMRIGGYWDLDLAYWHGTRFNDQPRLTQNIIEVGITPVFRLQGSGGSGPYAEAGVGLHYLSRHYNNNGRQLSTLLEFGSHLGAGYVFSNGWDLGLRYQHLSNGGIRNPNSGVNFLMLRAGYRF